MLRKRLVNNKKHYSLKPSLGDMVYILLYSKNPKYMFSAIYREPVFLINENSFTTQLNLQYPNWVMFPTYDFSGLGEAWFYTLEDAQRYIRTMNPALTFKQIDENIWETMREEENGKV